MPQKKATSDNSKQKDLGEKHKNNHGWSKTPSTIACRALGVKSSSLARWARDAGKTLPSKMSGTEIIGLLESNGVKVPEDLSQKLTPIAARTLTEPRVDRVKWALVELERAERIMTQRVSAGKQYRYTQLDVCIISALTWLRGE
jgi:hypothetical protein